MRQGLTDRILSWSDSIARSSPAKFLLGSFDFCLRSSSISVALYSVG